MHRSLNGSFAGTAAVAGRILALGWIPLLLIKRSINLVVVDVLKVVEGMIMFFFCFAFLAWTALWPVQRMSGGSLLCVGGCK
jgi:hypothetical protein